MKKIYTKNAPEAVGPYSQAVVCDHIVYTSGQIAIDPKTQEMVENDITKQTHQVLKNLENVLKEAGSGFDHVIKTTCFLADINDFAAFNEVYGQYLTEKPARSCVAVKDLPKNALVEVECIAKKK